MEQFVSTSPEFVLFKHEVVANTLGILSQWPEYAKAVVDAGAVAAAVELIQPAESSGPSSIAVRWKRAVNSVVRRNKTPKETDEEHGGEGRDDEVEMTGVGTNPLHDDEEGAEETKPHEPDDDVPYGEVRPSVFAGSNVLATKGDQGVSV